MVEVIDQIPAHAGSLSGDRASGARVRRPTEKVQAMRGEWDCLLYCFTIDRSAEELEQEQTAHEQQTLAKAKKCVVRSRKRDQAAKAAQQDPLKAQSTPAQGPGMADIVPTVVDNAVSLGYLLLFAPLACTQASCIFYIVLVSSSWWPWCYYLGPHEPSEPTTCRT